MSHRKKNPSRRQFLRTTALATPLLARTARAEGEERLAILSALGDTLIPSRPGKPGYRDLEAHGITDEMNRFLGSVDDQLFSDFNRASGPFHGGQSFVSLSPDGRAEFLHRVIDGSGFADQGLLENARRIYRLTRIAAFRIFYSNFPEHRIPRDSRGLPLLKPGDQHQVTTPNTGELVTGWDVAGFRGPLTWEQERSMRDRMKQVHWHEDVEALIVRYRPLPSREGRRDGE